MWGETGNLVGGQVWLEDFLAKEKHVAGVKDEPKSEKASPGEPAAPAAVAAPEGAPKLHSSNAQA